MSDSRLEKFIYAICSMDMSDLPVPLSRIEKLWNCLITGETPDFEPLSRNEKYLMAMLDRYDISNLPAPMSRGEKLLYKIAVGETDLSDVPGYLSRYEELLKYLIENGGISEGDFEYVLYTLNQSLYTLYTTAEKPVKSAILKGNTMKNIIGDEIFMDAGTSSITNITDLRKNYLIPTVKISTNYLVMYELEGDKIEGADASNLVTAIGFLNHNSGWSSNFEQQPLKGKLIINSGDYPNYFRVVLNNKGYSKLKSVKINVIEYEEYMNDFDIPYFEGMQSVKMPVLTTTGKNLFDGEIEEGIIDADTGEPQTYDGRSRSKNFIRVPKNTDLYIKVENGGSTSWTTIYGYDENKKYLGCIINSAGANKTFSTGDASYIKWKNNAPMDILGNIQIEEGSTATTYEPYKTNILTVNEEVKLRGIGDVKDELNLLTGELTQRLINMSNLGDYDMPNYTVHDVTSLSSAPVLKFSFDLPFKIVNTGYGATNNLPLVCDKFKIIGDQNGYSVDRGSYVSSRGNQLVLHLIKEEVGLPTDKPITKAIVKEFLKENPIEVTSRLVEPIIKTVDLTVVDQDNQPTQLGTFENVTHVSLEAENLIPEVEMEVATNLLEDTVFNLTNAFNTLYPTAAKPVKSAILKGQTLVNLSKVSSHDFAQGRTPIYDLAQPMKANTTYTIFINVTLTGGLGIFIRFGKNAEGGYTQYRNLPNVGLYKFTVTPYMEYTQFAPYIQSSDYNAGIYGKYDNLVIIEGDYTNQDIPYFEGIRSVKMPVLTTTGKNLFDIDKLSGGTITTFNGKKVYKYVDNATNFRFKGSFKDNTQYTFAYKFYRNEGELKNTDISFEYSDGTEVKYNAIVNCLSTFTSEKGKTLIGIKGMFNHSKGVYIDLEETQLEESSTATEYEPYKSNILTVNEDVTLRGIGDVKDELNLLTGEFTQRIGEAVYTEKESWYHYSDNDFDNSSLFSCTSLKIGDVSDSSMKTNFISDRFTPSILIYKKNVIGSYIQNGSLFIRVKKEWLTTPDVYGLRSYLQQNPITVQYHLETESIKTVDLTIINQDGNETKLGTFDDTTHVLLESEGLIPTASLTVRTKIPSGSSTSLLMDDISTEQQQLETTVDEQSNNVDATMIATTEIFEETL